MRAPAGPGAFVARIRVVGRLTWRGVGSQLGAPLTYLAVLAFYLITGWLFRTFIVAARTANLTAYFDQLQFLLVMLVPVLTMRSVCDELRTGAIDLLWVRGVRPIEVVIAKFVASVGFVLGVVALHLVAVAVVTARVAPLDPGVFAAQIAGTAGVVVVLVGLGTAASALSANPLVAAVVASMTGLFLWFFDLANLSSVWLQRLFALRLHLAGFQLGEVRLDDVGFFAGSAVFWLAVAVTVLRSQRAVGAER